MRRLVVLVLVAASGLSACGNDADRRLVEIYCEDAAYIQGCEDHVTADYVREGRTQTARDAVEQLDGEQEDTHGEQP